MKGEPETNRLDAPSAGLDTSACGQDAIEIPWAIQPHGILLAVRSSDLRVVYASSNVREFLHLPAGGILGRPLPHLSNKELLGAIASVAVEERAGSSRRLTIPLLGIRHARFYVVVHRVGDLVCLEIEPSVEGPGWDQLSMRIETVMESLRVAETTQDLCVAAAKEIRKLSGYDRVMIYRFHSDDHGAVIAEDKVNDIRSLLDLHFPASDIPSQARSLYLLQRTRLVADAECQPVSILGDAGLSQGRPLDMTYCNLRSVSPSHIQYMKNMGVAASFSISLIHRQKLWGLVLCHHRSVRMMPPEIRSLCDLLGQMISVLIGVTQKNEQVEEQLANERRLDILGKLMPPGTVMAEVLEENTAELLGAAGASGAVIRLQGHTRLAGSTPPLEDSVALMDALCGSLEDGLVSYSALHTILPGFAHLGPLASGGLMVAVGDSIDDCVLWLRPEMIRTIDWGGNPGTATTPIENAGRNSPRESFAAWRETQRGHSRPWTEIDLAMVRDFERMLTVTLLRHADLEAQLSNVDSLTKLPNRRMLLDRLANLRKEPTPNQGGLIFMDIDRFKIVNDTLGHAAGDDLLIQVARRLSACAGESHLAARMGGDEFVVLCEETPIADAEIVARRIVESFQHPFLLNGKPFRCATSVGLAPMGGGLAGSIADILHSADSAMYAAKRLGGNRVVVFEKPLREELMRQIQLEQDLFLAIEREEMTAHFQPQISILDNSLIGFEALLRWVHPIYGNISPAEFIPMAERSGHIGTIGLWVLKESLRLIERWRRRYSHNLFVAVNVSGIQLAASDFADRVKEALDTTRVPAAALHLEVTESMLIQPSAEAQFSALQALGVKIAIDDFGTGYSSLAYLQRLSISELKLDSTFLADVGKNERKTTLFGSIVRMAHTLKLGVIAEGVEDTGQLQCIRECACDAAQGYLFSKAIPADRVEAMLLSGWEASAFPSGIGAFPSISEASSAGAR
jgi:diguanylate cyclase (GGDEF)-like protein